MTDHNSVFRIIFGMGVQASRGPFPSTVSMSAQQSAFAVRNEDSIFPQLDIKPSIEVYCCSFYNTKDFNNTGEENLAK